MLPAKATAPFRLCGDKIRTPVDYVSKAICFCLETIIDGGFLLILGCYAIVAIMGFSLCGAHGVVTQMFY